MTRQVTIDWNDIKNAVKQHFSVIGKRLQDKSGSILFSKVTLSSAEEDLIKQYVNAAAEVFVSEMSNLVSFYDSGDFLVFDISSTRIGNENGIIVPFEGNFMGFMVAYIANAVLGMNYPELAKKYAEDMQNHLNSAIKLIYTKKEPSAETANYSTMSGSVDLSLEDSSSAEQDRQDAEATRQANERRRKEAESDRETAEDKRVAAEKVRVSNENARIEAEKNRVSAEEKRELAEKTRNQNVSDALSSIEAAQGYNIVGAKQVLSSQEDKGLNILQIDYKNGQHTSIHVYNGSKGSQGEKGDKGDPGEKGEKGDKGADGGFADLGDIKVSVDAATGTPSASVSNVLGSDGKAQLTFKFSGIKGEKGEDGKNGKDGTNGTNGEKGDKGDAFTFADFTKEQLASLKGEKGDKGDMGSISKVGVSVDSEVGTPSATATVSKNTDGSTNIDFSFTGLKGEKGDKGEDGTGTNVTQKVSKARTRIVCRKAIRLGATKANGNLVKYFTHFPTISLNCKNRYIIYLNDALVDVKALYSSLYAKSVYFCPAESVVFSDSGEVSFTPSSSVNGLSTTFSVPIETHQRQGYLYHLEKVTLLDSGAYEVRVVKGKTSPMFSYNTENTYLSISNGKLVSKVTNVGKISFGLDIWLTDAKGKNFLFESYVKARVRKRRSKTNGDQAGRKTDWYKYRMIPTSWIKAKGKTGLWKHYLYYKGILVSESRFVLSRIVNAEGKAIYNIMEI